MLSLSAALLPQFDVAAGDGLLGVSRTDSPLISSLFLHVHLLGKAIKEKKKVLFVSRQLAETNLRIICTKLAIRWDPNLIRVLEMGEALGMELGDEKGACERLAETIERAAADCAYVMIEDASTFDFLGAEPFVLLDLLDRLEANTELARCLVSFSHDCCLYRLLLHRADYDVVLEPVGAGFGKDVTGTMLLRNRTGGGLLPASTRLLFHVGDRSMKCFPPGAVSSIYF